MSANPYQFETRGPLGSNRDTGRSAGLDGDSSHAASQGFSDGASTTSLLRELMHEVPALLGKELALARAEMRENLSETRQALTAASGGAVVLAGGYFVLLFSAVYALSNVMAPWLAALIVGAISAVVGYAMVNAGMKRLSARELRPERTMESLREDRNAIRGARNEYH